MSRADKCTCNMGCHQPDEADAASNGNGCCRNGDRCHQQYDPIPGQLDADADSDFFA